MPELKTLHKVTRTRELWDNLKSHNKNNNNSS